MRFGSRTRLWALLALLCVGCAGGDGVRTQFLSIGTAGTGGIYYPLGGALASLLSIGDSTRQFTAEVSGGSVENINRLRSGQIDLAFATANTVYEAFAGSEDFGGEAVEGLRIVAPLYPNFSHIMVADGVEAGDISEFGGLRVAVGPPGSGTEQLSREILAAHGLTYEDIDERFLSFNESASALRDRAIDAAVISVGYPAAAVLEATTTAGVRLLPIRPEVVEALRGRFPYYRVGRIPAGAYPGVDEPLNTAAIMNWVISMDALDSEVAAAVLGVLSEQSGKLERVHEMARQIDLSALAEAPIPLHSEAVAFEESGNR